MADKTRIEWADATWNPVTGCDQVSPGCTNCYAETLAERFRGKPGHYFERGFDVVLRPDKLDQPIRWEKPRRIFVNSMSDLFHEKVPDDYIACVLAVIAATPQHTYLLLTKRHGRMRTLLTDECRCGAGHAPGVHLRSAIDWASTPHSPTYVPGLEPGLYHRITWPLPNLHLGVSVEDQKRADLRIPALLDTPAAVRWLSCEPLLGPVDLRQSLARWQPGDDQPWVGDRLRARDVLHWLVVGGETGPGARPMHPDWARSLRDQCITAGMPFFFKQHGDWVAPSQMPEDTFMSWEVENGTDACDRDQPWRMGKRRAGRLLDGREWNELPFERSGGDPLMEEVPEPCRRT